MTVLAWGQTSNGGPSKSTHASTTSPWPSPKTVRRPPVAVSFREGGEAPRGVTGKIAVWGEAVRTRRLLVVPELLARLGRVEPGERRLRVPDRVRHEEGVDDRAAAVTSPGRAVVVQVAHRRRAHGRARVPHVDGQAIGDAGDAR